jgi:hypothetical protein
MAKWFSCLEKLCNKRTYRVSLVATCLHLFRNKYFLKIKDSLTSEIMKNIFSSDDETIDFKSIKTGIDSLSILEFRFAIIRENNGIYEWKGDQYIEIDGNINTHHYT